MNVWFLGGDNALLELAMNITGTVVVGPLAEAEDGGEAPELARIMPNPDLFRVLVEGGEVTIRGCGDGYDADACLELVDKTITVTGYQPRLRALLLGDGVDPGLIQQAVSNADDISPAQESLLAVLPGSVGGLVFRTAQFSYPAGYTFGEQAAPGAGGRAGGRGLPQASVRHRRHRRADAPPLRQGGSGSGARRQ